MSLKLKSGVKVLNVYQSKLQLVAESKRWKKIPIIFDEQDQCLQIIFSGGFRRPLHKTVRKHCGKGIKLYGGRKAFVDVMLDKDQKIEDISQWLGYTSLGTTWADGSQSGLRIKKARSFEATG